MEKQIDTGELSYTIVRSRRRTLAIEIRRDGSVLIRAPLKMPEARIGAFVQEKRGWIFQQLEKIPGVPGQGSPVIPRIPEDERLRLKKEAGVVLRQRSAYFAKRLQVHYNRITIREQRTRWGSCSSNQNLNFNWKLILAPMEVLDYVVVHELCHLKEMNHSPAYWREVEKILPDYERQKDWLKQNGWKLMLQ
ncbi:MAG: SprT family zinc-dependent metalloprotease [Eubacteriales bacterium]|nr:SprT family zinc-dependent metalloprotease [Eubacteriales bacterium]